MIYKISHSSQAQHLCQPPDLASPHRQKQWQSSRYALCQSLKELRPNLVLSTPGDFEIHRHHCLKRDPEVLVGLSHTEDYGAAIVGLKSNQLQGLGIDIEKNNRSIKLGAEKFFVRDDDDPTLKNDPLKLWMAKEAAYKAFFPLYKEKKVLVLKDFWIRQQSFGWREKRLGPIKFLPGPQDLSITIALLETT